MQVNKTGASQVGNPLKAQKARSFLDILRVSLSEIHQSLEHQTIDTQVDPLFSILAVLARFCQIPTTSWQPWIPWQDSY